MLGLVLATALAAAVVAIVVARRRRARVEGPAEADPSAETPAGQAAFAALVAAEVGRQAPTLATRYDPDAFRLFLGDGDGRQMHLHNLRRDWLSAEPAARDAVVRRFVTTLLTAAQRSSSIDDVRPRLLPAVRRAALQTTVARLGDSAKPSALCAAPMGEHLAVYLVVDWPDAVSYVREVDLAGWGLTEAEARAVALDNLRSRPLGSPVVAAPGLLAWVSEDGWASGLVVLADLMRELPVRGDPVVMVANPAVILIAGADDEAALVAMAEVAKPALAVSRPIGGLLHRLRGARWEPFLPAPSSAAYPALHALALAELGAVYADDKQARDAAGDGEAFVASLMILEDRATGAQRSVAVWIRDLPTLLPEAESIAFMADEAGPLLGEVPWDEVRAILDDAMIAEPGYPPRWRVTGWPTPSQLLALKLEGN